MWLLSDEEGNETLFNAAVDLLQQINTKHTYGIRYVRVWEAPAARAERNNYEPMPEPLSRSQV